MERPTSLAGSTIFPERRYADAPAAIDFLSRAFGFEPQFVTPGPAGSVGSAELRVGTGCIVIRSLATGGRWQYRAPQSVGGANTGSVYTAVADIDALHARTVRAGANVLHEPADTDYGSREFSACDPEGFIWHFGTYHPTADGSQAPATPEVFAGMRYRDARAAIGWLCRTFGFEEQFIVPGPGAEIAHAQLRFDSSLLMLGSARDDEYNMKTPLELDGAFTQTLHVTIADPDAHHARACAAGAEIVAPLADTPNRTRGYCVRDTEGHVWTFNTHQLARDRMAAAF